MKFSRIFPLPIKFIFPRGDFSFLTSETIGRWGKNQSVKIRENIFYTEMFENMI